MPSSIHTHHLWYLSLLIVTLLADTGCCRGLKKRSFGDRHHFAVDDSIDDDDWSSMPEVDDVASWFDQIEDGALDELHHHEAVDIPTSSSSTLPTTTTSSPSTTSRDRHRTRSGNSHAKTRSKQNLMTTSSSASPIATPSALPSAAAAVAATTLDGIVDIVERNQKTEKLNEQSVEEDIDPCRGVYCRAGRVCQPPRSSSKTRRGRCVCASADHCIKHHQQQQQQQQHRQVCGTDGRWYSSHCELHRVACVNGVHLGADRTGISCSNSAHHTDSDQGIPSDGLEIEIVTAAEPSTAATIIVDSSPSCTKSHFERMKANLLSYHCARDTAYDCSLDTDKKKFIVADMFDYYDWSGDNRLELNEMKSVEQRDHLDRLSQHCHMEDLLRFADHDNDGFISMDEFYASFGLQVKSKVDNIPRIFKTTVSFGNSVELKCDSADNLGTIVWKRNGNDLRNIEEHHIKVFADGSLYIGQLDLHHIGNYTCQNENNDVIQTHIMLVQMHPKIEVSPPTQNHLAGSTAVLRCRADGLPTPEVFWEINGKPITTGSRSDKQSRLVLLHNNATLEVKSSTTDKSNSASYNCIAKNTAGTSQDSATVLIEHDNITSYMASSRKEIELVTVFHQHGYTVYELNRCHVDHQVTGDFHPIQKLPSSSTMDSLCTDGFSCAWSEAVAVRGKFIYAAQPNLGRVVVIEIVDRLNPVEVILTDKQPISVRYVEHLDQVWVLCQSTESEDKVVAMVIRDASENVVHHAVHIHPTSDDDGFDHINGLFLPSSNDLLYSSDIGYAAYSGKTLLQKLDLNSIKYIGFIDLSNQMCVPVDTVFLPIGGRVVISCASPDDISAEPKKLLVLDYITNKIIDSLQVGGRLFVSPDLRNLVVLGSSGKSVSAFSVSEDGSMAHTFDEHIELRLNHVTFFPSASSHGYSLFAVSTEHSTVFQLDLTTGKVQLIKGAAFSTMGSNERAFITSAFGQFAGHLVALMANDSVVVIDGARHHIDCEWQNVASPRVVVPLANRN